MGKSVALGAMDEQDQSFVAPMRVPPSKHFSEALMASVVSAHSVSAGCHLLRGAVATEARDENRRRAETLNWQSVTAHRSLSTVLVTLGA